MALKDLTTPTLITILDGWLDPAGALPKLKQLARSAALLGDLEAARTGLQASHAATTTAPAELKKLGARAAELDAAHDRKARGIDKVIDGLGELTDDADLSAALAALRGEVLGPKGLTVITTSYTDEAQNAKLADKRFSPGSKTLLGEVMVHDRSLAKWVKNWQGVAKDLGEVETERAAIEAKTSERTQPADAVRARNKTIRVINAMLVMIDLDDPGEAVRMAVLGSLESALSKADRRGSSSKAAAVPTETPPVAPGGEVNR